MNESGREDIRKTVVTDVKLWRVEEERWRSTVAISLLARIRSLSLFRSLSRVISVRETWFSLRLSIWNALMLHNALTRRHVRPQSGIFWCLTVLLQYLSLVRTFLSKTISHGNVKMTLKWMINDILESHFDIMIFGYDLFYLSFTPFVRLTSSIIIRQIQRYSRLKLRVKERGRIRIDIIYRESCKINYIIINK